MTWGVKLGFTVSLMLSDESASMRVFGVSESDFASSFNPTYRLKHDIHVAPLGLGRIGIRHCYKHIILLGLWVGHLARPTGIGAVSRFRRKLGFTVSLMLSDESASMRVFGVSESDFASSFNPTYRLKHDIHVAPLGLGRIGIRHCYKHIILLGLWVGQDARPTGIGAVSRFRRKLGFTVSLMLSDEAASVWVFGVAAPDLSPSFNPTSGYPSRFATLHRLSRT